MSFQPHPSRVRIAAILSVAVVLLAHAPVGQAIAPAPNLIVGFDGRYVDLGLLGSLGATVLGANERLGIAAVHVLDVQGFTTLALLDPDVAWVETNDRTYGDSSSWDATGWDATGWDANGWDATGWDATGWDANGWDATGWDGNGWDGNGWDATGWDATGWDANGWDATGWDGTGWDATGWDGTGWDGTGWDATGWDANGWDGTGWDSRGFSRSTITSLASGASGTDPLVKWQWGLAAANVSHAATRATSAGVTICIPDSGVDHQHPDLASKIARDAFGRVIGYDFVNGDSDPMDDAGHGTHVAGIAAAATGNGKGIAGISQAKILPVKVLGSSGVGKEYDLALAIDWCTQRGADVISMSLGSDLNTKAVHRAVVDAFSKGVVMVASVGNTGTSCDCVRYPAAYPQVIAVGAHMPNGMRAPYSAVSAGVDFVAPGYAIVSAVPGGYRAANGTSQAVPFVAAAAALLLAEGATGPQVGQALKATAHDLGPTGHDPMFGHGSIDTGAALAHARK